MFDLFGLFKNIEDGFLMLWWIWLPAFFYFVFFHLWLFYIRQKYFKSIKWIVLEIKPSKEVMGSPKPFEYIFTGLYGVVGTIDYVSEIYLKGMIQAYFSLEIVGINGEIHFFVRIPFRFRNLVESQFYAQYPDIEIREVDDYIDGVPATAPNAEWDLWGTKMILTKPDPYPIRTYSQFLEISGTAEDIKRFIDPLSSLMEILSKLKEGEQIWVQFLCRPAASDWQDEGKKIIDKILGRESKKQTGLLEQEVAGWTEAAKTSVSRLLGAEEFLSARKEEKEAKLKNLSSGEQEIIKAIEQNISKMGFDTKINFIYLAKKELMSKVNVAAMLGMFGQFNTLNLNGFKHDKKSCTSAKGILAPYIKLMRKRNMFSMCRERSFWEKGYVLNIEELATVFHFPATAVVAPMTPRIELKKGVPPIGLPIEK